MLFAVYEYVHVMCTCIMCVMLYCVVDTHAKITKSSGFWNYPLEVVPKF